MLIGTWVRCPNGIVLVFLKPLSISHREVVMGKMIACPRICFKTLHQKLEEERIDETRTLVIKEFEWRLLEGLLHYSLYAAVCLKISVTKME